MINARDLEVLEYPKIIERLSAIAQNELSREAIRAIQPTDNLVDARETLEKTSDAFMLCEGYGVPPFSAFEDMRGLILRAKSGSHLTLRDLLEIKRILSSVSALDNWHERCALVQTSLDDWFLRLCPLPNLLDRLERSILTEGTLADTASMKLAEIRRKLERQRQKLRDELDAMMQKPSVQDCLQDTRVTMRDGRYVLPVRAEMRGKIDGLVHDSSSSGATVFIEPMAVVQAGNDIRLLEAEELEEINRIIDELCAMVGTYADTLITDIEVTVQLEVYFARAILGREMKGTIPQLTDDGIINLKQARHPLITADKVVPIDISLGDTYRTLMITGPNTGGKTVSMKTCGLCVLMAMSGMMIPAAPNSQVSIFSHILADIGDTQSIEADLSTFSAHMTRVKEILDIADVNSLVLLDELGSGTDPIEGAALGQVILDQLGSVGARVLISTHYQQLKLYAMEKDGIEVASMTFDVESMTPTYQLIIGVPGKSMALAICEGLGFSASMITRARQLVGEDNLRFENAIASLQHSREALEEEREQVKESLRRARADEQRAKNELDKIEADKARQIEIAGREASQIVEQTKAQANALLDELEGIRKEKDKASFSQDVLTARGDVKRGFRKMYETANPVVEEKSDKDYALPRALCIGDTVEIMGSGQKGTVVSDVDKSGSVFIQLGTMRTKVKIEKLKLIASAKEKEAAKKKQKRVMGKSGGEDARRGTMELDIRGCTCDEGIYQMESFLDNAVMSHIGTVTIIHGKGTGVLRKAIQQRLRQLPYVESFRVGSFGEGEDGVTIVTLKG